MTEFVDARGRPKESLRRFSRQLVGLTHLNKNGNDRLALARSLSIGTPLVLVPEQNNVVDRNALLIYRADDLTEDLGYLDATGAKQICRMIECGARFEAEVYWIDSSKPQFPKIYIWVYQLTAMTRNHRPVRRNAPNYRGYAPHREAPSTPASVPCVPSFREAGDEPKVVGGPIRSLIWLLKSFLP